jgi:hypothetical protein
MHTLFLLLLFNFPFFSEVVEMTGMEHHDLLQKTITFRKRKHNAPTTFQYIFRMKGSFAWL